ncbi:MAG: protein kinase [Planctomycetota bacterium]
MTERKKSHDEDVKADHVPIMEETVPPSQQDTDPNRSAWEAKTVEHTPIPVAPDPEQQATLPSGEVSPDSGFDIDETVDSQPDELSKNSKSKRIESPTLVGQTIGDYRFDAELGRGGMGVVYKAHHLKLRRDVAIKMILGVAASDPVARERFETEARAVASLKHPNVVQLYEFGLLEESPFLALEFVRGGTLSDVIKENPLPPKEAARILEHLALAMQAAHDRGILHRDLKPANVLMEQGELPKVSDFGLAKELIDANQSETKTGTIMGTPSFMSPEQARGRVNEMSGATDQYSLGALLYACLSGRPPFMSATTIDTITQVVKEEPVPLRQLSRSIPADLETICLKTLQKEPEKRYSSCKELADDLGRFQRGEPISARPISTLERAVRWCKRNPRVAIPTGFAALFFVATAIISSWAFLTTKAQAAVIIEERDNAEEQRDEARRQKIIANEQKAKAEENQELAENQAKLALENIQFTLTDVDRLLMDKPGMSELRLSILDAVRERWDELDINLTGGVRGEAIPTMMALRQKVAIIYRDLDELESAANEFEKLIELCRERIALKGRNDATRTNLAKVYLAASQLERRRGEPKAGIEMLEQSLEVVDEIIDDPKPQEGSPSVNDTLELRGAIAQNLGVEMLREGDLPTAERYFSKSLADNEQVLASIRNQPGFNDLNDDAKDTQTAAKQISLDKSRLALAYIRLRLGKTAEALELYKSAIESRREIYDRRPTMLIMKSELAGHLKLHGKSLLWLKRVDEARPILQESLELGSEIVKADPESVIQQRALGETLYLLASVKRFDEQSKEQATEESIAQFERARLVRKDLFDHSDDDKNRIALMLAEAAVNNSEAVASHVSELLKGEGENSELHLEIGRAYGALALNAKTAGDDEQTKNHVDRAMEAIQQSVEEGYSDPFRLKAEWELELLQDMDEFKGLLAKLVAG